MADTIEAFVARLQAEGVEAGRKEAEQLKDDARKEAEAIAADARKEADGIVARARNEAESIVTRGRTELELAARDTVLRLRESLNRALEAVLAAHARETLSDSSFLGKVLHDIVLTYTRADAEGSRRIEINIPPEQQEELRKWALKEIGQERLEGLHPCIDLKATLKTVGFEYSAEGGRVEVTEESVVEMLKELVSPRLREVVENAVEQGGQQE
jgi:V/A-type H+-transporting ATPase subunit E